MEKTISYIISKDELLTPSHLEDRAMSNFGNMFQLDLGGYGGVIGTFWRNFKLTYFQDEKELEAHLWI